MYEKEIKYRIFRKLFELEGKDSVFLNEFTVDSVRADIAVFNGNIHLLEIKSPRDSLRRLETQINYLLAYSEKCSLVVHARHYPKALKVIPKTVGLLVIEKDEVVIDRPATERTMETIFLADLWWSQELKILLGKVLPGASRLSVEALRKALIELLPYGTLCLWTKESLKFKFKKRSEKLVKCILENCPLPKWEMPSINKDYLLKLRQKLLQDGVQKKASFLTWDCQQRQWKHQRCFLDPHNQNILPHERIRIH